MPLLWTRRLPLLPVETASASSGCIPLILAGAGAVPDSRCVVVLHVLRSIIPDVLPAVGGCVAAGSFTGSPLRLYSAAGLAACLFVEGLLGDAEGIYRSRHATVEHHLGDDFGDLLLGNADVQRTGDVPLDHLWAMANHHQRGDGTQAAGA